MSDLPGRRVRLRLPDGREVDAGLLERRQAPDGSWTYTVAVEVPAAAVTPVDGEEYNSVPTWRPFVLHGPWFSRPGELHTTECARVTSPRGLGVRSLSTREARNLLTKEPDTLRCMFCRPEP